MSTCLQCGLSYTNYFPLPPFQKSVAWEGREGTGTKKTKQNKTKKNSHGGKGIWGEGARGKKITMRIDPSPSLLVSSVNYFECFGWKCNFQFSILHFCRNIKSKPCHRMQYCRKSKIAAQFIFLFIVDRIKVKIWVMFQYFIKRKKSPNFRFGTFVFFMIKNNENPKLTSIFNFWF